MLLFCILSVAFILGPQRGPGKPAGLEELVNQADAVLAVEIVATDYTATAADGPMYAEARVLRVIKGKGRTGAQLHFGASAWVGPSFRAGERRIIFLQAVPANDEYYGKAPWTSLDAGKIDLFIAKQAVEKCTQETLADFLKQQERLSPPRRAEFR